MEQIDSTKLKPEEIEIKKKIYSIDKVPDEDSDIVKEEKEKLFEDTELETLARDLDQVGTFIRIAINGVVAAGPKFTKQLIEIQRLSISATKISDESITTIKKFKWTSSKITTTLQSTYQFLLDNHEKKALETMTGVSKLAKEMEEKAKELLDEFEKMEKKVEAAFENMLKAKGEEAEQVIAKQKELKKLEIEQEHQKNLIEEQLKHTEEAITRRRKLEELEDKAIVQVSSPAFKNVKRVMNALTIKIPYVGFQAFDIKGSDANLQAIIEATKRARENEKKLREVRQKNTKQTIKVLQDMAMYKKEEEMAEVAEKALHHTIKALKDLILVAMRETKFWNQIYEHCKSLASSDMQEQIKTVSESKKEQQSDVWTSKGFKIKAIEFYAGWVALHSICGKYVVYITKKKDDLKTKMQENPTYEQSRQNVQEIAKEYLEYLKKEGLKAIED